MLVLLILGMEPAAASAATHLVVVQKSQRSLMLFQDGELVKRYPVALGSNPKGDKQRRGDKRTPEGKYYLTWTNTHSKFYKSLHITYPNDKDRREARRLGVSPGGDIKIHGLPNQLEYPEDLYLSLDWTDGCIAMSNRDLDDLLKRVPYRTPIYILP